MRDGGRTCSATITRRCGWPTTAFLTPDGKLLGDWKKGEQLAQRGTGGQFSDKAGGPIGGNCYACHQLAPSEVSFGTLGPTLLAYGKNRKFKPEEAKAAYAKIYNAQAVQACSNMPRFGHNKFLSEQDMKDLTAYLFDARGVANRHLTIPSVSAPINGARKLKTGVQMIDDGILTFDHEQRRSFLEAEPNARPLFREFLGGDEYINGFSRSILYLADADPALLRSLPKVTEHMRLLREYRSASNRPSTIAMAEYPTKLGVDERLTSDYLVIPNTSSERRAFIPIGWLGPDVVANQKLRILPEATL